MRAMQSRLAMVCLAVLAVGMNVRSDDKISFPASLDAAAVTVDRLDSVLDYALLIGNGDINALVYTDRGQLKLNLTKNDVWDARLDAERDPPLPTMDLVKKWAFERGVTLAQNGAAILDEDVQWERPGHRPERLCHTPTWDHHRSTRGRLGVRLPHAEAQTPLVWDGRWFSCVWPC